MRHERVAEVLERMRSVRVAVYGDFCLDAYWILDPRGSEVSVETGLQAKAVARHYYSLGGASNVVANLATLAPAGLSVVGVVGDDVFGRELARQLGALGVDTSDLLMQGEGFDTMTFGKQYLQDEEAPRLDFGMFNRRTEQTDRRLLRGIRRALEQADAVILNQQVPGSITRPEFIEELNELVREYPDKPVLVDSRHYGEQFRGMCRKTNDIEAARLNGENIASGAVLSDESVAQYAGALHAKSGRPVFVTRGARGILAVDADGCHPVPGIQLLAKLDTVGAGDTAVSALALCLAARVSPREAAEFANFAAAVTVQKLFQTGTASAGEILAIAADPDYIYQPELAADARRARHIEGTEVEVCADPVPALGVKHVVFDHDGTISTLRQGWEEVMAPMMMKAVLGESYDTAGETLYHRVRQRVLNYIEKSTGVQTIVQMEALVELVREFGIVPPGSVLDKFGYKEAYNRELMQGVRRRIARLERDELDSNDFTVKGAVAFLEGLRARGVTLYLASGTDRDDVVAEATALGYAGLFEGRIYGAVGDVRQYSKKMVLERIVSGHRLAGGELAVCGDGPVEIRECRKRGGVAIGVASDEVRRHGLNPEKRTRLIKAGAQFVLPDFSQAGRLFALMET